MANYPCNRQFLLEMQRFWPAAVANLAFFDCDRPSIKSRKFVV